MTTKFLEAGQIVNTHGIRGEVKIVCWCDSPEFLCDFDVIYIDDKPVEVELARPHKGNVIAKLAGINDVNAAMCLKEKIVHIDRDEVELPEGRHFLADLYGLEVRDAETGAVLGTIHDVLTPPANEVYVVKGGAKEYMIPAVEEFLVETNVDEGYVSIRLIEGMEV